MVGRAVGDQKTQRSGRKSSTVLRTVRLPEAIDEILIQEANERGLSPNALVSMVMTRFAKWDRFADRFHFICVTRELLMGFLDVVEDEKLQHLAEKSGTHTPKEAMVFWFKEVNVESLIRFVDGRCKYAGYGDFEHSEKQGNHTLTIRHELGPRWSAYLKAYFDAALRKTFQIRAEIETTEHAVIMNFRSP